MFINFINNISKNLSKNTFLIVFTLIGLSYKSNALDFLYRVLNKYNYAKKVALKELKLVKDL